VLLAPHALRQRKMKLTAGNEKLAKDIADHDWFVLDIGFSSKKRTCGILKSDNMATDCRFYADIEREIAGFASSRNRMGLIIEAPLSYAFDARGNPCGRSFEFKKGETRYWFTSLGCAVMTAALFLLRRLHERKGNCEIVLFEGFVSFKKKITRHEEDALRLFQQRHYVLESSKIAQNKNDIISGITNLFGVQSGVPAIVICEGPVDLDNAAS
jgi:hypothetical protein